jgi:hypothetical protein
VLKSSERPLIVEWPATDRSDLESLLGRGLVPVRYTGCEVELLRNCSAAGSYGYKGTTRETERESMRNADELYAKMPIGAARFEAMVERGAELTVAMTVVGKYMSDRSTVREDELQGEDCARATHVVTGLTAGAFEFFSQNEAAVGGDAAGVVGGHSSDQREMLRQAGEPKACEIATRADTAPPNNCGALLRMEVARVACADGKRFVEGEGCVSEKAPLSSGGRATEQSKPNYQPLVGYLGEIGQALLAEAQGKTPSSKWHCYTGNEDLRATPSEQLKQFAPLGSKAKLVGTGMQLELEVALPASYASPAGSSSTGADSSPPKLSLDAIVMAASDGRFRILVDSSVGSGKVEASGHTMWVDTAPAPFRRATEQLLADLKTCTIPLVSVEDVTSLPIPEVAKAEGMKELGEALQSSQEACQRARDAVGRWTVRIVDADLGALVSNGPLVGALVSELTEGGQPFCIEPMRIEVLDKK